MFLQNVLFLQVMKRVLSETSCRGNFCSVEETSLEFLSIGRRCFEKVLEPLCATIDCKFDAKDEEECAHTTRPKNVSSDLLLCPASSRVI